MYENKVILTDCDGVLLDWEYSFSVWMKRHGYTSKHGVGTIYSMQEKYDLTKSEAKKLCRIFNESATIRKLPPLRDAIKYVQKLHREHGFVFHCITSMTTDEYAQHLRTKNLCEMFGPTVFETYIYLDTGADKDDVLLDYKDTNCYWVEDKAKNVDVGIELGLRGIIMNHEYNKNYNGSAKVVNNWKEIYNYIVGE
jgi:FMN phosphatase YigB (HAD superfamily)